MKTKLLFGLLLISSLQFTNAQTISLIGDFNSWNADVDLTTTDNVTYTLTGWTLPAGGTEEIKFRENHAWTTAWGRTNGSATGWPSGTGDTTPGGGNIIGVAGTYDVTFNINTGAYDFTTATLAVAKFTKNIQFYYVNNDLKITGYQGKVSIKAYDIIGRLSYNKKDISVQNGFSKAIKLPENQVSIILIKGKNFTKSLKVIAHQ